uniref:AlNc14C76G5096 protein n=1 Tax=Albugo laibachii Nc14 TaxID=890382 RepID=F0WEP6_9STRA|nr:AlNc14C76G5096 [Albugo laibachii Nc14]|eukprot:CCA19678.1 AlNc14C76G5096 [Albugo laibachii Nc14]
MGHVASEQSKIDCSEKCPDGGEEVCSKKNTQYPSQCALDYDRQCNHVDNGGYEMSGACAPVAGDDGSDCNKNMCTKKEEQLCNPKRKPKHFYPNSCHMIVQRCLVLKKIASDGKKAGKSEKRIEADQAEERKEWLKGCKSCQPIEKDCIQIS